MADIFARNRPGTSIDSLLGNLDHVTVTSDAARLDVNVDYGNVVGYFVRIDVELPRDSLYPTTRSGRRERLARPDA